MQAHLDGKEIEFYSHDFNKWNTAAMTNIIGIINNIDSYRIKPEQKFRPFKNAEECWAEIQKHQPVGFVKFKNTKSGYYMVTFIASGAIVGMNNTPFSYEDIFDSYAFADGTPFGIKE